MPAKNPKGVGTGAANQCELQARELMGSVVVRAPSTVNTLRSWQKREETGKPKKQNKPKKTER